MFKERYFNPYNLGWQQNLKQTFFIKDFKKEWYKLFFPIPVSIEEKGLTLGTCKTSRKKKKKILGITYYPLRIDYADFAKKKK